MKKRDQRLQGIEARWVARFGEVPTLRTDPGLMEEILDQAGPLPESAGAGRPRPFFGEESVV